MVPLKFSVVTEKTVGSLSHFSNNLPKSNWLIFNSLLQNLNGGYYVYNFSQVFSTPEASIGFHTDCGFSFIHSRLPGHLGKPVQAKQHWHICIVCFHVFLSFFFNFFQKIKRIMCPFFNFYPMGNCFICCETEIVFTAGWDYVVNNQSEDWLYSRLKCFQ